MSKEARAGEGSGPGGSGQAAQPGQILPVDLEDGGHRAQALGIDRRIAALDCRPLRVSHAGQVGGQIDTESAGQAQIADQVGKQPRPDTAGAVNDAEEQLVQFTTHILILFDRLPSEESPVMYRMSVNPDALPAKTRVPGFSGTGGCFSSWLSHPENLKAMRRLGTLGEGGFLMQSGLHGLEVERTVRYDVHRLNIPNWQSILGQPLEEALHLRQGQRAILGYHNGEEVFTNGAKNSIENVYEMGNGVLGIEVRETVGFGTGTKIDAGIKGLVSGVSRKGS